jgi:hypothetical protein
MRSEGDRREIEECRSGADKIRQAALWGNTGNDANPISDMFDATGPLPAASY